ncbi:Androgen-induced gene 1 protein [Eumeta japonica]|uniref:Androgen-induced gene 1 protein n=1 Tax=Eumeta variegata TaxID=151549 RepID=A0A4C1W6R2_EUMVA|nr:Androgen-induced gene 1 protein [Eumeta japonica]
MWYDQRHIDVPFPRAKAFVHLPLRGRSVFLTTWSFYMLSTEAQTVYFAMATANDVFGTDEALTIQEIPLIRSIKDMTFAVFAFPGALYVATVFWLLYAINREIILPRKTDKIIPSWLNHLMHTTVVLFATIEMYISPHSYPSRQIAVLSLVSVLCAYIAWMLKLFLSEVRIYVVRLTKAPGCFCKLRHEGPQNEILDPPLIRPTPAPPSSVVITTNDYRKLSGKRKGLNQW